MVSDSTMVGRTRWDATSLQCWKNDCFSPCSRVLWSKRVWNGCAPTASLNLTAQFFSRIANQNVGSDRKEAGQGGGVVQTAVLPDRGHHADDDGQDHRHED